LRTLEKVNAEALLIAAGQNVKRLVMLDRLRVGVRGKILKQRSICSADTLLSSPAGSG